MYFGEYITSPDLFKAVVQKAMCEDGITDYVITRADIAFDSYNENDFELYAKLNRFVISLMSISCNMPDRYESKDFLTIESLNIAVKSISGTKEIEAYNKKAEANCKNRNTKVTNRLEFRRCRLQKTNYGADYAKLAALWIDELTNAVRKSNVAELEKIINNKLVDLYRVNPRKYSSRTARADSIHSINAFITAHQQYIYTRCQLIAFYKLLGIADAEQKAADYKRNHNIEFFSRADLKYYINIISDTAESYITYNDVDVIKSII
jgi:hypothetical protein